MIRLAWFGILLVAFLAGYLVSPVSRELGIALFVLPIVAFLVFTVRRSTDGAKENNRAVSLLSEGRYVEAIAAFERADKRLRSPLPRYNIGNASVWLWRLDDANRLLEKATSTLAGKPLRIMVVPTLAFIAAIKNDRARSVLVDKEVESFALTRAPMVQLSRAAWLAREGRWGDVQATLSMDVTRRLGGPARCVADALRAWALAESGQPVPPIVDPVGIFGETGPDALRKWWPEFADFLVKVGQPR